MSLVPIKDFRAIIGYMRRVFARSDIIKTVVEKAFDPSVKGKRGGKMYKCSICSESFNRVSIQVDHINPVIPVNKRQQDFTLDQILNNMYCEESNLHVVCKDCHKLKTAAENALRKWHNKDRKKKEGKNNAS